MYTTQEPSDPCFLRLTSKDTWWPCCSGLGTEHNEIMKVHAVQGMCLLQCAAQGGKQFQGLLWGWLRGLVGFLHSVSESLESVERQAQCCLDDWGCGRCGAHRPIGRSMQCPDTNGTISDQYRLRSSHSLPRPLPCSGYLAAPGQMSWGHLYASSLKPKSHDILVHLLQKCP